MLTPFNRGSVGYAYHRTLETGRFSFRVPSVQETPYGTEGGTPVVAPVAGALSPVSLGSGEGEEGHVVATRGTYRFETDADCSSVPSSARVHDAQTGESYEILYRESPGGLFADRLFTSFIVAEGQT